MVVVKIKSERSRIKWVQIDADVMFLFPEGLLVKMQMSESAALDIFWNFSCQPPVGMLMTLLTQWDFGDKGPQQNVHVMSCLLLYPWHHPSRKCSGHFPVAVDCCVLHIEKTKSGECLYPFVWTLSGVKSVSFYLLIRSEEPSSRCGCEFVCRVARWKSKAGRQF